MMLPRRRHGARRRPRLQSSCCTGDRGSDRSWCRSSVAIAEDPRVVASQGRRRDEQPDFPSKLMRLVDPAALYRLSTWRRAHRRGHHRSSRSDLPSSIIISFHQNIRGVAPSAPASSDVRDLERAVNKCDGRYQHPYCLDFGHISPTLVGASHRLRNTLFDRGTSSAPLARRGQLLGVVREELPERLPVLAISCSVVPFHNTADRRLVPATGGGRLGNRWNH